MIANIDLLTYLLMFSGFLLFESSDKSLNWLNSKVSGFRFMKLPVFVLCLLLLRTDELSVQLLSVQNGK